MDKMKFFIVLFTLLISTFSTFGYTGRKVILLVNRNLQKDTIGYNIADDFSRVCYEGLKNGTLKLWETPEKLKNIAFTSLVDIEKNTHASFTQLRNMFVYEEWSVEKNKYKFSTKGLSFTGMDSSGKDIFFGYIEVNEILLKILQNSLANVNADGYYGTTLLQELQSRHFEFDVVFFKNKPIRKFTKAQGIIKDALSAKNIVFKNDFPRAKLIEYSIEAGPSTLSDASGTIISGLQNFFNENPQEFFNLGGDKIFSYLRKTPIILSSVLVNEIWTKSYDSLKATTVEYIPVVIGNPIQGISFQQMNEWNLKINSRSFNQWIVEKKFYYRITKVNSTLIDGTFALSINEELLKGNWQNLNKTLHGTDEQIKN